MLCLENDPLQYDPEYWRNVNKYRLPGTTVNDKERPYVTIAQKNEYLSSKDFVGTLSAGDTGISVMQLESYHSNGELLSKQFYKDSGEYGGPPPQHDCTLTANKAYFFLKDLTVCLGSAINAKDGANVYTVLDNRKGKAIIENGKVTGYAPCSVAVNGKALTEAPEDTALASVKSITVDGTAICPLTDAAITVRKTEGEVPFVEILWQHGIDPENGSYAYAILPDANKLGDFISNAPVTVIRNDETVQMIKDNATGDLYCVFHEAAQESGISADKPLLVSVKDGVLYVCDATQKAENATVTVDGKAYEITFKDNTTHSVKLS